MTDKKKNKKWIFIIIGIILLILLLIGAIYWYDLGAVTRQAKKDNLEIKTRMNIANSKLANSEFIESKELFISLKSDIELLLYNDEVDSKFKSEILQKEYDDINNKLNEINTVLANLQKETDAKQDFQDRYRQYKLDYDNLVVSEKNITTIYKYNPTVISELNIQNNYVNHCADLSTRILDLKDKSDKLYNNITSLNLDTEEYNSLLSNSRKSKELFYYMYLDYNNWCDTRAILQEIGNFENANVGQEGTKYYMCTEKNYYEILLNLEQKRQEFLDSVSFDTLRQLILEKNYPFDITLQKIDNSGIESIQYDSNKSKLLCSYLTNVSIHNNALLTVTAKCKNYETKILNSDRGQILNNLKQAYESCYEILILDAECNALKNKYPESFRNLNCDFSDIKAICDSQKNQYNSYKSKGTWDCAMGIEYDLEII